MIPSTPITLEYQPSLSVAIVGIVLSVIVASYQIVLYFKLKTWFFYWIILSALLHVIAFSVRTAWVSQPDRKWPLYISYIIFTCALSILAAACHATFGRILQCAIKPNDPSRRAFLVPIGAIAPLFLGLDVAALGFQALGAALICTGQITSGDATPHDMHVLTSGVSILKWSLVGQLIYLGVFALITIRFLMIYRGLRARLKGTKMFLGTLAWVAGVSSALIMLHGVYQVVELNAATSGFGTFSKRYEWVFYVVNILPIFIIYLAFSIVHPGKCLPPAPDRSRSDEYESYDYHDLRRRALVDHHPVPVPKPVLDKPLPPLPSKNPPVSYAPSRPTPLLKKLKTQHPGPSSRSVGAISEISPYQSKKSYQAYMSGGL